MKMKNYHYLYALLLWMIGSSCFATLQPLPMDQAFRLTSTVTDTHQIVVSWKIAPNYYLYRNNFDFKIISDTPVVLGQALYPDNIIQFEDILGTHDVYQQQVTIKIPYYVTKEIKQEKIKITLQVHYQGCAHTGFCYPPTNQLVSLLVPTTAKLLSTDHQNKMLHTISKTTTPITSNTQEISNSTNNSVTQSLYQQPIPLVLLSFLGFGLLLTFTPCILPMIPIVSSIVLGQQHTHTRKALLISLTYVFAMSLTFALAGIAAALLGYSIQAYLQNPWVIVSVSLLLCWLALSLLGCFEIQLPQSLQAYLNRLNQRQKGGTYLGAFAMGVLATLVVSPCVTPPLIGALTYIAHSGNVALGGSALFFMGLGMGIPLIVFATLGTRYLPKSGPWMEHLKYFMGLLLLAVVVLLITRIVPGPVGLVCWAALLCLTAIYLGVFNPATTAWTKLTKTLALLLLAYAMVLIAGAALGESDPLHPLGRLKNSATQATTAAHFNIVYSSHALQAALTQAQSTQQPAIVDFWAKWCLSCNIMDQTTFKDPKVMATLAHWHRIKVDITQNSTRSHTLTQEHHVIAPPVLDFYDSNGHRLPQYRVVGEISAKKLLAILTKIAQNT